MSDWFRGLAALESLRLFQILFLFASRSLWGSDLPPQPLCNWLSDVWDEVAKNFLSSRTGAPVLSKMLPPLLKGP